MLVYEGDVIDDAADEPLARPTTDRSLPSHISVRLDAATHSALAKLTSDGTRASTAVRAAIIMAAAQHAAAKPRPTVTSPTRQPRQRDEGPVPGSDDPEYLAWVKQQAAAAPPLEASTIRVLIQAFTAPNR